jgi:hypothetical protein
METLITFKTAKLAKEKGFDIYQKNVYVETLEHTLEMGRGGDCTFPAQEPRIIKNRGFDEWHIVHCQAPSQSVLTNWLLEKHELFVTVELAYNEWGRYSAIIYKKAKDGKTAIVAVDGMAIFDNPIDAWEEGLFQALNLI